MSKNTKVLIYGRPDVGKTTLALTANNPVILDFDNLADKARFAGNSVPIGSWGEALDFLNSEKFKTANTVILDTISNAQDWLNTYLVEKNYKLKSNKLQLFGAMGEEMISFVRKVEAANKDIVLLCHETKYQDNEIWKFEPSISGNLFAQHVERNMELIGRMFMENGKRTLSFETNEFQITKGNILGKIVDPYDLEEIIYQYKTKKDKQQAKETQTLKQIKELRAKIRSFQTAEEVNKFGEEFAEFPTIIKLQLSSVVKEQTETLNLVKDEISGLYVKANQSQENKQKEKTLA